MPVDLNPQLESAIRDIVQSGKYVDANDVVREALNLLKERDRYLQLRAAVKLGLDDAEAGRVRPWSPARLAELHREAVEEDRKMMPISADVQP